jgi:hypothetical protein
MTKGLALQQRRRGGGGRERGGRGIALTEHAPRAQGFMTDSSIENTLHTPKRVHNKSEPAVTTLEISYTSI